jgi:hypothetical protein
MRFESKWILYFLAFLGIVYYLVLMGEKALETGVLWQW